jgi:hypothetical protein
VEGDEITAITEECDTVMPSDLYFGTPDGETVMSTKQDWWAAFGDVFRVRNCTGEEFVWAKQQFFSWGGGQGVAYEIYDPNLNDKVVLTSRSAALFDSHMIFEDDEGVVVGEAFMSFFGRKTQGVFCTGGRLDIHLNATTSARDRQTIVALAALKVMRDQTRNNKGQVTGSWCNGFYMFKIVGLPIMAAFCLLTACSASRKRRRRTGGVPRRGHGRMLSEVTIQTGPDQHVVTGVEVTDAESRVNVAGVPVVTAVPVR